MFVYKLSGCGFESRDCHLKIGIFFIDLLRKFAKVPFECPKIGITKCTSTLRSEYTSAAKMP